MYSVFQVEAFFVIKSLKEMGLSLPEIKNYMANKTPETCMDLLSEHIDKLYLEIKKHKNTIKLMKEKLNVIENYFNVIPEKILFVEEEQDLLFITKSSGVEYYDTYSKHVMQSKESALNLPCAVGHITKNENFSCKTFFDYYFSKTKIKGSASFIKQKGRYINYYHSKGYYTVDDAYKKIISYAEFNNIRLGEYFFEYMILDELSVNGLDNYVVKISIEVLE